MMWPNGHLRSVDFPNVVSPQLMLYRLEDIKKTIIYNSAEVIKNAPKSFSFG